MQSLLTCCDCDSHVWQLTFHTVCKVALVFGIWLWSKLCLQCLLTTEQHICHNWSLVWILQAMLRTNNQHPNCVASHACADCYPNWRMSLGLLIATSNCSAKRRIKSTQQKHFVVCWLKLGGCFPFLKRMKPCCRRKVQQRLLQWMVYIVNM